MTWIYFETLLLSYKSAVKIDFRSCSLFDLITWNWAAPSNLTGPYVSGLFSWPDKVVVSPSTSTPTVLRHHTVSPHYVRSDMQSSLGNDCSKEDRDRGHVFVYVYGEGCVFVSFSVSICVSGWAPQPVAGLLLWFYIERVSSSASSPQTDKHTPYPPLAGAASHAQSGLNMEM